MSGVRVLVGTRKGAFILTSDGKREKWDVSGPHFAGWEIYHVKGSPADPNRIYASQTSGEFFGVWELVKPTVPQARERFAMKGYLAHLEKAAQRYEAWSEKRSPGHVAAMRQFMQKMRAQPAKAA